MPGVAGRFCLLQGHDPVNTGRQYDATVTERIVSVRRFNESFLYFLIPFSITATLPSTCENPMKKESRKAPSAIYATKSCRSPNGKFRFYILYRVAGSRLNDPTGDFYSMILVDFLAIVTGSLPVPDIFFEYFLT
jgi:hypothetical protein